MAINARADGGKRSWGILESCIGLRIKKRETAEKRETLEEDGRESAGRERFHRGE